MDGDITSVIFKGVHYEIEIMAGGFEWLVDTTQFYTVGTHVGIRVIPFNIQIMNKPESEDEEAAKSMSNFKKQLLAGPYLIWMIGFILLPLVFILYYAITAADGSFTFSNIAAIADPVHVKSILLSLKLGFLCTLFCLVLSYPLCMILSTFRFRHQSFVVFCSSSRCG